jgi:transposase
MMQFTFFVGIDVSKETLDFSVVREGVELLAFQTSNTESEIKAAVRKIKNIKKSSLEQFLFCFEQTGIYNNVLVSTLNFLHANIWIESPIQIKRSSGMQRGKSDKVDARRIALYAFRNRDIAKLWAPPRLVIQQLKKLASLRDRLVKLSGQLKKPIQESKKFDSKEVYAIVKNSCQATINGVKADLKKVNKQISDLIKSDPSLKHLFEIVTSVDGIGKVVACDMIVTTNEFKSINDPKKYACYAGVVPFEHSSGSSIRGRNKVSNFANKNSKRLIHMAAMSIIRYSGELRTYWLRKLEEGKHKMVVLNAIRNKLIQRVFAVVRRGEKFERNYTNALA